MSTILETLQIVAAATNGYRSHWLSNIYQDYILSLLERSGWVSNVYDRTADQSVWTITNAGRAELARLQEQEFTR